jgi:hypothetical protein
MGFSHIFDRDGVQVNRATVSGTDFVKARMKYDLKSISWISITAGILPGKRQQQIAHM